MSVVGLFEGIRGQGVVRVIGAKAGKRFLLFLCVPGCGVEGVLVLGEVLGDVRRDRIQAPGLRGRDWGKEKLGLGRVLPRPSLRAFAWLYVSCSSTANLNLESDTDSKPAPSLSVLDPDDIAALLTCGA